LEENIVVGNANQRAVFAFVFNNVLFSSMVEVDDVQGKRCVN